jgi:ABC-type thiamine transport system ATPase subunit
MVPAESQLVHRLLVLLRQPLRAAVAHLLKKRRLLPLGYAGLGPDRRDSSLLLVTAHCRNGVVHVLLVGHPQLVSPVCQRAAISVVLCSQQDTELAGQAMEEEVCKGGRSAKEVRYALFRYVAEQEKKKCTLF